MKPSIRFSADEALRHTLQCVIVVILIMAHATPARATCPADASPPAPQEILKDSAELLYEKGEKLLATEPKDYATALDLFLNSRKVYPSPDNSLMAALCLRQLGRYPEALALYKEILERFDKKLSAAEKTEFQAYVEELEKKVLVVYIRESEGFFAIDNDSCGSLPQDLPAYLEPGTHALHLFRKGKPEAIVSFSGDAGTVVEVRLPPPPPPPAPSPFQIKLPDSGRWFVQTAAGPAIAWSGIGSLPAAQLEQSAGVLAQAYGGYRLPNGIMIALNTGLLYLESSLDVNKQMGTFKFGYTGTYQWEMFSSFVALTGGWGTSINERSDVWFRVGLGLMSTQSKHVFADAGLVPLFGIGGSQAKNLPVDMQGREVIRSVPGYASFEVGGALRVGALRVGLLFGGLFILEEGPLLPTLYVMPRAKNPLFFDGTCANTVDPNDADCVPKLRFFGQQTYRPAFIFLPQLVVGF